MSHMWISAVDDRPPDATAAAPLTDAGKPAGVLAAWKGRRKPHRSALRAHPRLVDPSGESAWVSLVLVPERVRLPFDDPAVQAARREVLVRRPFDAVSALMRDASHFEGAIAVARGPDAVDRLRDDPFARVLPARILHVGAGLLGTVPPPTGPATERYGSANPWPMDRFEGT